MTFCPFPCVTAGWHASLGLCVATAARRPMSAAQYFVVFSALSCHACVAPPWEVTRTATPAAASLGGPPVMTAFLQPSVRRAALPRLAARCVITISTSAAGSMRTPPTLPPSRRIWAWQRRRSRRRTRRLLWVLLVLTSRVHLLVLVCPPAAPSCGRAVVLLGLVVALFLPVGRAFLALPLLPSSVVASSSPCGVLVLAGSSAGPGLPGFGCAVVFGATVRTCTWRMAHGTEEKEGQEEAARGLTGGDQGGAVRI